MSVAGLIQSLGYDKSRSFLTRGSELENVPDYGHVFRKAVQECLLCGVYALRGKPAGAGQSIVPVVYVCEAATEVEAALIHRRVWNQNVVPFLLVDTPKSVRLYSGFRYERAESVPAGDLRAQGILENTIAFNEIAERLSAFRAEAIDDGLIWSERGEQVTSETRVDWRLLEGLRKLGEWLFEQGVSQETAHAIIGKFVYLRYLRDRKILSDRKLAKWQIHPDDVFSRRATLTAFRQLEESLEEWLNGSIFPVMGGGQPSIRAEHLQRVAGTFSGDDPLTGQLHLDFEPYNFSYIPIETLSIIYEQFLHASHGEGSPTRGKSAGAYYTPVPLANFVIEELHDQRPLTEGMKVLDPSCGSGTFLVQCYRRLIEQRRANHPTPAFRPVELQNLLEKHIFGVDRDPNACRVTELSLILTLLDYVDLEDNKRNFKLPILRDRNIFQADFFDPDSTWSRYAANVRFDWVVGNPPWTELKGPRAVTEERHVWNWMSRHADTCPVAGNQVAEAFAWKATSHVSPEGSVGLLMPATTLFNDESAPFRREFFRRMRVSCVANFANLAYVLFRGSENPAAAFFYHPRSQGTIEDYDRETVRTVAPFVANQQANRPQKGRRQVPTWNIVLNTSEVRELQLEQVATGDMLPWKVAMWGTHHDYGLIRRVGRRLPSLEQFAHEHSLRVAEGFQLRGTASEEQPEEEGAKKEPKEKREFRKDLVGKLKLHFKRLRRCGRIFSFPPRAWGEITAREAYLRLRGGRAGLEVSYPPHIIVDASRRFAVYSDDFIAVPARQIGISGASGQETLLRALALYLSSDFTTYHQFLTSPAWGVNRSVATLSALRGLPVPLARLCKRDVQRWGDLYESVVLQSASLQDGRLGRSQNERRALAEQLGSLLSNMNEEVFSALGLRPMERALVRDLVHVRMRLAKGKVSADAVEGPSPEEMQKYADTLQDALDGYVESASALRHRVVAVHDDVSAMISVELTDQEGRRIRPAVLRAGEATAAEFERTRRRLRRRHSQWVYFDRALRIYEGPRTYLFKPMQRMLWTRSNALVDAGEIIADTLVGDEAEHAESSQG